VSVGPAGAVLAGGRSSRLGGRPKAFLPLEPGGAPLILRVLGALEGLVDPVLISTASPPPPALEALGKAIVPDRHPGTGPLGALASVLEASPREHVLVVACDMPSLSRPLLAELVRIAREHPDARAIVPRTAAGLHPLHAVYARALLPELRERLRAGRLALHEALYAVHALEVSEEELRRHDPTLASLENLNTPEDLARAVGPERARALLGGELAAKAPSP
jgi:molybdopterin-guanine dinucleotide biosynthesis protein A